MSRDKPRRFVDAHLHLWDQKQNPWYQLPTPENDLYGLGLKQPFPERYAFEEHRRATAHVELVKWVHVSAVAHPKDVEAESAWITSIAEAAKQPYAIVGAVDRSLSFREIEALLDRELMNSAYRGIRFFGGLDYDSGLARAVFPMLASRNLVFDATDTQGGIRAAAKHLARHPELVVVLEHIGGPRGTSAADFQHWRAEMAEFAALPNVFCKLSGAGLAVHGTDSGAFGKFFAECVHLFGANRCMFATNFPVDLIFGTGDELFATFDDFAGTLSAEDAEFLFVKSAEQAYRL